MNLSTYKFSVKYNKFKNLILNNLLKKHGDLLPIPESRRNYNFIFGKNSVTDSTKSKYIDLDQEFSGLEKDNYIKDNYIFDSITWSKYFMTEIRTILNSREFDNNTSYISTLPASGAEHGTLSASGAEHGTDFCSNLEKSIGENAFAIMGHCITGMYLNTAYDKVAGHIGCDGFNDCIMSACVKNGIPKLFFIDNAISYANNMNGIEEVTRYNIDATFNIERANKYEEPYSTDRVEYVFDNNGKLINPEVLVLNRNNNVSNYDFFVARSMLKPDLKSQYYYISSDIEISTGEKRSQFFGSRIVVDGNPLEMKISAVDGAAGGTGAAGGAGSKMSGGNMYHARRDLLAIEYYNKYLKYKQKYLHLKNK
jgi:hypothetical protein